MSKTDQPSPFTPFQWTNYTPARPSSAPSAPSPFFPSYSLPSKPSGARIPGLSLWWRGADTDVESQADPAWVAIDLATCGLTYSQRLLCCAIFILLGMASMLVAFVNIPISILRPQRFVVPFSLGSMLLITWSGFVVGWDVYFRQLLAKDRLYLSLLTALTIMFNLYSSLVLRIYLVTVAAFIVQLVSMSALMASFVWGGSSVMAAAARLLYRQAGRM